MIFAIPAAVQGASLAMKILTVLAVVAAISGAGFYAGQRWEEASTLKVQADYDKFKNETKSAGDIQQGKTALETARLKALKRDADNENDRARDSLVAYADELRKRREDPGSSVMPDAPADTERPDLICFDRVEFDRAQRESEGEAEEIAIGCTANTIDLNTAKRWAQNLGKP